MALVSLIDVAKRAYEAGNPFGSRMILSQFVKPSMLLDALQWETTGGSYSEVPIVDQYGAVGFRGINEAYSAAPSTSKTYQYTKAILGGTVDIDKALLNRFGDQEVEFQLNAKAEAMRKRFESAFIKGDTASDPREFNGLQVLLNNAGSDQLLPAGSTSGGDALNLSLLDLAVENTYNPTHWIMNKTLKLAIQKFARTSTQIDIEKNDYGYPILYYAGLPIISLDKDHQNNPILPFTEANPGGGTAASTSVYCVSLSADGVTGQQTMDFVPEDLGDRYEGGRKLRGIFMEWDCGIKIRQPQSVVRIHGIKNVAVVDS